MNLITSIYIPHVEKYFNAEYIADAFRKSKLAQVSMVYIKPYKLSDRNRLNIYNRVFIKIQAWYETESAYNFIQRLRNPNIETRLFHNGDNWWVIKINKYPNVFNIKRVLTVFYNYVEDDLFSTTTVCDLVEDIIIDVEKTNILRQFVLSLKERICMQREDDDSADLKNYLREIDRIRQTDSQDSIN